MRRLGALACALTAFLIAGTASAAIQKTIYTQGFEDGPPALAAPEWATSSSLAVGRVEVCDYDAHDGGYALFMDVSAPSGFHNLNEAVLTVDLSGATNALLRFWHADWDGPAGSTSFQGSFTGSFDADGIAISADGNNWHPIWQAATQSQGAWQQYSVDLSAAAQAVGIEVGPSFRIRFQQFDNLPRPFDGRAWDDIAVTATVSRKNPIRKTTTLPTTNQMKKIRLASSTCASTSPHFHGSRSSVGIVSSRTYSASRSNGLSGLSTGVATGVQSDAPGGFFDASTDVPR